MKVLLLTVSLPPLEMPPPESAAGLLVKVLPFTVSRPEVGDAAAVRAAELLVKVLLITVAVPSWRGRRRRRRSCR